MRMVGLQLYSIREDIEKDFAGTLKAVAEYGYDGVQLAGDYGKEASEWKTALNGLGLKPAGMHVPLEVLENEALLNETIQFSKEIENTKLIIPYLPEEWRTEEKYKEVAEMLNVTGRRVQEQGLTFGYHHHDFEFLQVNETTGWDILEQKTVPDVVHFEIDVYWTEYSGVQTNELLKRLNKRVLSLHIKDMVQENGEKKSTSVGKGTLKLKEIILQTHTDWLIVEQEHFNGTPLNEVSTSAAVIKNWLGEA
ncbi:sugar phosphate isomerase/epimerase family protein [Jeotgalibacillus soli]|uniref:Xylose isomerase-like TIM barrel domain-containing protein n=1 Tax=Jeotgalibacillus soli TaxID=889306 RepID=A0A0C2S631_9BACL|nr:sugar phosphate isomerase/epimerase [Jeotgalibacillus soli]KIL49489.1 hypothetical protein KP78_09570 [Jeotgalibacillus soli]